MLKEMKEKKQHISNASAMKKCFLIHIAILLFVILCGCSSQSSTSPEPSETPAVDSTQESVRERPIKEKLFINQDGYPIRKEVLDREGGTTDYYDYSYTNDMRIALITHTGAKEASQEAYSYDSQGRIVSDITYINNVENSREEYEYGENGISTWNSYREAAQTVTTQYTYNSYGNIETINYHIPGDDNDMIDAYTYTSGQELLKITCGLKNDPECFGCIDFVYENEMLQLIIDNMDGNCDYSFHYDDKNNLESVTWDEYEYDEETDRYYIEPHSSDHCPLDFSVQPGDTTEVFLRRTTGGLLSSLKDNKSNVSAEYYDNGKPKVINLYYNVW